VIVIILFHDKEYLCRLCTLGTLFFLHKNRSEQQKIAA
jgi:hypothetical protein